VDWLGATLALYQRTFTRGVALTLRNWTVLGTVFVYSFVMTVAVILGSMLGLLGGFLVSLVWAACVGSFLSLVETIVRTSRVSLDDFRRSFGAYLWEVVGVIFVFWILFALAGPALSSLPQGPVILLSLHLVIFVFFNAVPELIYLGHSSTLDLLRESYTFIGDNWIEWFPPTLAMVGIIVSVARPPLGGVLGWAQTAAVALLIYLAMVVRGLLFLELHGSSRRARAFRHRMGG
jgi:hypothetical protein